MPAPHTSLGSSTVGSHLPAPIMSGTATAPSARTSTARTVQYLAADGDDVSHGTRSAVSPVRPSSN